MKNISDIGLVSRLNTEYKKYEVNARHCGLRLLDTVTPVSIIGINYKNGQLVKSESFGRVAIMYYNPMHDSFIIMIVAEENGPSKNGNNGCLDEMSVIPGLYLG